MTIKSLLIENLESHVKTRLRFHKGVNVIVGDTDAGKSGIMRALTLLMHNRPGGDEFVNDKTKDVIIKAKIDDRIVKRVKGKENLYYLDKQIFRAFGQSVPEKIAKFLNISEVNIQHQLDQHFLLSKSSGEVAKYFNKIVRLDIISRSLKNISTLIKNDNLKLKNAKEDRDDLGNSIKKYDWLVDAEDEIRILEMTQRSVDKITKQIYEINSLIDEVEELKAEKGILSRLLEAKPKVDKVIRLKKAIDGLSDYYTDLVNLIDEVEKLKIKKEKLSNLMEAKPEIEELIQLNKKIEKKEKSLFELSELIKSVKSTKELIKERTLVKKELEKQFKKLMPDTCPLCDSELEVKK